MDVRFATDRQSILAGRDNQARAKNTGPLAGTEQGVADMVPTKNLDRTTRMAGMGHQGDFVNRYFNDPEFQAKTKQWNYNFLTGGSQEGLQQAEIKMQSGQPLV